jgi:hypothetical protein
MPDLSEEQARALADEFLAASEAVSDFRFRENANLSTYEVLALKSLEQKLSNQSDDLTAMAIRLTLDNLNQTIAQIVKTTGDARAAIAKLNDIGKAVSIAANLVALGGAIATGNPEGILTALQNTKDSFAG